MTCNIPDQGLFFFELFQVYNTVIHSFLKLYYTYSYYKDIGFISWEEQGFLIWALWVKFREF